jgi:hypothetical protein
METLALDYRSDLNAILRQHATWAFTRECRCKPVIRCLAIFLGGCAEKVGSAGRWLT